MCSRRRKLKEEIACGHKCKFGSPSKKNKKRKRESRMRRKTPSERSPAHEISTLHKIIILRGRQLAAIVMLNTYIRSAFYDDLQFQLDWTPSSMLGTYTYTYMQYLHTTMRLEYPTVRIKGNCLHPTETLKWSSLYPIMHNSTP